MRVADLITAVAFLIFSLVSYFYLIPNYIVTSIPIDESTPAVLRPDFFPRLTIFFFAITSVCMGVSAFRAPVGRMIQNADGATLRKVGLVFLLTYGYVIALKLVGFLIASWIFMPVMIAFLGLRDWRYVVPVAFLFPVILERFFWLSFQVILPEGSLF